MIIYEIVIGYVRVALSLNISVALRMKEVKYQHVFNSQVQDAETSGGRQTEFNRQPIGWRSHVSPLKLTHLHFKPVFNFFFYLSRKSTGSKLLILYTCVLNQAETKQSAAENQKVTVELKSDLYGLINSIHPRQHSSNMSVFILKANVDFYITPVC